MLCTPPGALNHTLFLVLSIGCPKTITQLVTTATCLANRGLVKLAMKRFRGAAEDLGGVVSATAKVSKNTRATTAPGDVDPGDKGIAAALAGGALDCLDSELGRALAEGRLQNGASREVLPAWMQSPTRDERNRIASFGCCSAIRTDEHPPEIFAFSWLVCHTSVGRISDAGVRNASRRRVSLPPCALLC